MERFALRVASGSEPTSRVVLRIPDAVTVLGLEPSADWTFVLNPPTAQSSATIEWSDGRLEPGEFREFAFFARLAGDARRKELIFPVTITRADGDEIQYSFTEGNTPPPVVLIVGSTAVSPWGAVGLAGVAVAIAIVALALSASRRRSDATPG